MAADRHDASSAPRLSSALALLSEYAHTLSHAIRTPLSVVVNELSYLHSQHPELELADALARAKEIAAVLSAATPPGNGTLRLEPQDVVLLVQSIAAATPALLRLHEPSERYEAPIDAPRFRFALQSILREMHLLSQQQAAAHFSAMDGAVSIAFTWQHQVPSPFTTNGWQMSWSALRGREHPTAPLIDAILLEHGIEVQCRAERELVLVLRVPQ